MVKIDNDLKEIFDYLHDELKKEARESAQSRGVYEACTNLYMLYEGLQKAGFSEERAFDLVSDVVKSSVKL